jgi:hypothetical protein
MGSTRMYYNYGGILQIHGPNGKTLGVATAPWSWFWSDWTFKIKPEFYAEGEGISVDGIYPTLLWLAEEDNGVCARFAACVCEHVAHARSREISHAHADANASNCSLRARARGITPYFLCLSVTLCIGIQGYWEKALYSA